MRRSILRVPAANAAVALVLCLAAAIAATPASAQLVQEQPLVQSTTTIPPDLQALEAKMAQLQVKSESFSIVLDMSGLEVGKGFDFPLIVGGKGVIGNSPLSGSLNIGLFGMSEEVRIVGGITYTHDSDAGEEDGGRPWVRSTKKGVSESVGVGAGNPSNLLGPAPAAGAGTFAGLIEAFNREQSIVEVGPAIVEGQPSTEFDATLDPKTLLSKGSAGAEQLFEKVDVASAALDLFIAPSGLPVRTTLVLGVRSHGKALTLTMTIDLLAIEVPVIVEAPPASEVIDEAALQRIRDLRRREQLACARWMRKHLHPPRRGHRLPPLRLPPSCTKGHHGIVVGGPPKRRHHAAGHKH